ncbi:aminotransferase, partial [Marinosulfonomonas sp. PRT-SC04]
MTGSINDIATLRSMAKDAGALVFVDAVQLAPHHLIDVRALGCDFLVCSSYKFFGPHLGIMWGKEEVLAALHPYK